MIEQFLAVPQYGLIRFGRWDSVLAEPKPRASHTFATTMWHAARGIALAATGRNGEAVDERATYRTMATQYGDDSFAKYGYPADSLIRIAGHLLNAAIASGQGNDETLFSELHAAVELEDALPYMEPPYWFFPNREILGAALLKRGHAAKAEAVYRADLEKVPNNGWALQGLAASLRAQGRANEALAVDADFARAWERADVAVHAGDVSYF